jgi:hypothetical protein
VDDDQVDEVDAQARADGGADEPEQGMISTGDDPQDH